MIGWLSILLISLIFIIHNLAQFSIDKQVDSLKQIKQKLQNEISEREKKSLKFITK